VRTGSPDLAGGWPAAGSPAAGGGGSARASEFRTGARVQEHEELSIRFISRTRKQTG
jgi:hypothetical protein